MRLARVAVEAPPSVSGVGGTQTYGILEDDGTMYDLPRLLATLGQMRGRPILPPATMLDAAITSARWGDLYAEAKREMQGAGMLARFALPPTSRRLAPLTRPNRIFAIGRNYGEHAKELGNTVGAEPIVFLKPSTCVVGPDALVEIPVSVGRVDFEGELLVVLGRGGKHVAESDAMSLVAGYTIFNDITAREMQKTAQGKGHPWFIAKGLDTFGPMGPHLTTADAVPDPHTLRLQTRVNGEVKQDDTTGAMIFPIPFLIAYLSRYFRLEPGDVIATGTPAGVGPIVPGDTVTVAIDGLGTLSNPVVAAE